MKYWQRLYLIGLLTLSVVGFSACSDDASATISDNNQDNSDDHPDVPDNPVNPDDPIDYPTPPESGWDAILTPNMASNVEIAHNGISQLAVRLTALPSGEPIIGERIKWGLETGKESVALSASTSTTKEEGVATITVRAREVTGDAVAVASYPSAPNTVKFNIQVLDKPLGSIYATASYNGNAPVENYNIKLYSSRDIECARFDPIAGIAADPLLPAVDSHTADFSDLDPDLSYTLIAHAFSTDGAMVAAGCLDSGTRVYGNQITNALIYLDTIDLNLSSTYHVRSYFDLGDVVSALGTVGNYITTFTNFVDNPGQFAYDAVVTALETFIPSWIVGGIDWVLDATGLQKSLTTWLNNQLIKSSAVCNVGLFACQFRNIIRLMEFTGNLNVVKSGSVELRGSNEYNGLAVYWRFNCNDNDPNCGRLSYSTDQLKLGKNINFLEGTWDGSIANAYDKLSIESHELSLRYGEIVTFLINQVLLPKVTGDPNITSFDAALAKWINVQGLANWLHNSVKVSFAGLSWQLSQENANSIANTVFNTLKTLINFGEAFLALQSAKSDIFISGTAKFADTNIDNTVDIINNGNWAGSMTIKNNEETKTTAVKGIWSAYNRKNVEINGKMYCTYPKTIDADARVCDFPVIDLNSLNTSDMCGKYKACAGK